MIGQVIFILIVAGALFWFTRNVRRISKNIARGRPKKINDRKNERWMTMLRVAFGQTKLLVRPVPGILHFLVYAGFILINIEILEIVIDGIFGTHRVFAPLLGNFYGYLIAFFEILALAVWLSCLIFLIRRNVLKLRRFSGIEMKAWPKEDANIILISEILLMTAFLTMNAADQRLQALGLPHYFQAGLFPVSSGFAKLLPSSASSLELIERSCWWFHIIGIFAFLNYLPYSKHFHIILAFPNTWYSNLEPKGKFSNMQSVTNEVKGMLDPAFTPPPAEEPPGKFGAKDVTDLSWKNLMDSYSCTQCGRCTSECPANLTGKLLSPRKIVMDTRNRLTELGLTAEQGEQHGQDVSIGKSLLGDYISSEELWACTSCNACTEACPVNIDPLAIIVELRRFLVMEESNAPASLNAMFTNIENNGAPWQFSPADRLNWAKTNE